VYQYRSHPLLLVQENADNNRIIFLFIYLLIQTRTEVFDFLTVCICSFLLQIWMIQNTI
jgi:hypothetical protein